MHSQPPATNGVPSEVSEGPALMLQIPFYLLQLAMHLVPSRAFLQCCCVLCTTLFCAEISQTILMAFPAFITDSPQIFIPFHFVSSQIILPPLSTHPSQRNTKASMISHLIETNVFPDHVIMISMVL